MSNRSRIILLSIFMGLFFGFISAIIDYFMIEGSSLTDILFTGEPLYKSIIRFGILLGFTFFGFFIAHKLYPKVKKEEAKKTEEVPGVKETDTSYNFRTPINAIIGFSELLDDKNLSEESKKEYISYLSKSKESLDQLIKDKIEKTGDETQKTHKPKKKISDYNFNWENKIILIAEDIESNYKLLSGILNKTKVKIIWAQNGKEAVEVFKKKKIDLVLMDILMPEMDGYEATRLIKEINPSIPVIAQTAYTLESEAIKDFDEYLTKPIWYHDLYAAISKYFEPPK